MNCRVTCSLICALAMGAGVCRAANYSLSETYDGSVYTGSSTATVFQISGGPPGELPVTATPVISGTTHDVIPLMQFDLSGLPLGLTGAEISSAQLVLRMVDEAVYALEANHGAVPPTVADPFTVNLFANDSAWNAATTYGTIPGNTTGTPIAQQVLTETTDLANNHLVDVTFDVTSIVKDWVDGITANNGFKMLGDHVVGDGTPAAIFVSSYFTAYTGTINDIPQFEIQSQADGPQLIVATVPEPSAVLLTLAAAPALAGIGIARRRRRVA